MQMLLGEFCFPIAELELSRQLATGGEIEILLRIASRSAIATCYAKDGVVMTASEDGQRQNVTFK
eukprot:1446552-Pleurochrysis_carterae.AAC.1